MDFNLDLNENQLKAVTTSSQNVRVIAGAGSGKTRVLTYRIAYLIGECNVNPYNILAISFTNKAAGEIRDRIIRLLNEEYSGLTIRTFHSLATYFLRIEIDTLDYPSNFTILDEDDQLRLMKEIVSDDFHKKKNDPLVGATLEFIERMKLEEKYPEDIDESKLTEEKKQLLDIYEVYEYKKKRMYCLDFDDLLLYAIKILENNPDIREKWQNRYRHILVDEFQDTNDVEFHFLSLLLSPSTCLYVVGDPDQTIYTWRGTNANIIVDLEKKTGRNIETIILDRNYRSTSTILDAANKLIAHNQLRVPKDLYCDKGKGEAITPKANNTHNEEAEWLAREVNILVNNYHYKYSDIAVLYRSAYVTLDFEQVFGRNKIPYRIYGGVRFYQRAEIKDVLAFMRLVNNPDDDVSFSRIINVPSRGIGEVTESRITTIANSKGISIYHFVESVEPKEYDLPPKPINSLKSLIRRINDARKDILKNDEAYSKILEQMILDIGYFDYLKKQDDNPEDRMDNVRALIEDIRKYQKSNPEATFNDYLQDIALVSSQDEINNGNAVSFMTVHTAKGLEFPVVFIIRFNDGIFPHNRSLAERGYEALEEERRLAYVAFTRAKERLYISFSCDYSYVVGGDLVPSRFISEAEIEIPELQRRSRMNPYASSGYDDSDSFFRREKKGPDERKKPKVYKFSDRAEDDGYYSQVDATPNDIEWHVGDIVEHDTLGKGVVIALLGDGIIEVDFENEGKKSILGNHPKVKKGIKNE